MVSFIIITASMHGGVQVQLTIFILSLNRNLGKSQAATWGEIMRINYSVTGYGLCLLSVWSLGYIYIYLFSIDILRIDPIPSQFFPPVY